MPHKFPLIKTTASIFLLVVLAVPVEASEDTDRAVAELLSLGSDAEFAPSDIITQQTGAQFPVPDVLETIGGLETGRSIPEIFADGGLETVGSIPDDVWTVIQSEAGLGDVDIGSGFTIEDIWKVVSTEYELLDYGSIFADNSGFGSGIITNFTGNGGTLPSIPTMGGTPPITPGGRTITTGDGTPTITLGAAGTPPITAGAKPQGINPFRWIAKWSKENILTPLMKAFGVTGKKTRTPFKNEAIGELTRNSIVKRRDQSNMLSQELARMMASPRLGVEGEAWMESESKASMVVLDAGVKQIEATVTLAQRAQDLTSTQDVAKAVAQISGHNAQAIGASLQLQTQSQASLLQLQQLQAANIELGANISEALDEANRRERMERDSVFAENAGETLYLRGIWSNGKKP